MWRNSKGTLIFMTWTFQNSSKLWCRMSLFHKVLNICFSCVANTTFSLELIIWSLLKSKNICDRSKEESSKILPDNFWAIKGKGEGRIVKICNWRWRNWKLCLLNNQIFFFLVFFSIWKSYREGGIKKIYFIHGFTLFMATMNQNKAKS